MPDFDPSAAKLRIGSQKVAPQIPAATIDRVTRFRSEQLTDTFNTIEFGDDEIDGTTLEPESVVGNIVAGPKAVSFNLRATKAIYALDADLLRYYAAPVTPSGATNTRDQLFATDSTLANDWESTVKALTLEIDRDDGFPRLITGARVQQAVYTYQGGQVVQVEYMLVWLDNTPFASPSVISDITPNTTQPVMTGMLNETEWAKTDKDIYVKVDSVTGGPPPTSIDLLAKVGSAASYGSTTFTVSNFDVDSRGDAYRTEVIDSTSGAPLGTFALPVYIFIEVSTDYEAADEWRYDPDRAAWTPSYEASPRFADVENCVTVDGVSYYPQNYSITVTKPFGPPDSWVCKRRPPYVIRRGNIMTAVAFTREQRDRDFVQAIENFESMNMVVTSKSDTEIETGFNWQLIQTLPNLRPATGSEQFTVTGAQERGETINFKAFSGSGPSGTTAQLINQWRGDVDDIDA